MAFNPQPPRADYQATAGQTIFPFLFKIYFTTDINVYHTPISTNITTKLIEGIDYSVVINGDDGGIVTLILVVENNDYIVLERELELTRYVEYQTSGDLLADTLNADQDYQTYLVSDQNALRENSIYLPQGTIGVDTELPFPVSNNFFKWNSTGTAIEYSAPSELVVSWGNISGTLSDQTDLQNALDAKLDVANPTFTGILRGPVATFSTFTLYETGSNNNLWNWGYDQGALLLRGTNTDPSIVAQRISPDSKTLEQTSTNLNWGGTKVVLDGDIDISNKIEADDYATDLVGGTIKILVSDTDCYITTDGSTPGP